MSKQPVNTHAELFRSLSDLAREFSNEAKHHRQEADRQQQTAEVLIAAAVALSAAEQKSTELQAQLDALKEKKAPQPKTP